MLNKMDDYPIHQTPEPIAHPGTSDPNFYDRTWFNGYDSQGERFFGIGMAVYPHRHILDCAFSTVEAGGRQHSFYGSRRAPQERTDMQVGPMRLEIVEPLRAVRVILDENEHGIACDLTFTALTSPIQEARQTLRLGVRAWMDATRFAQFGRWSGTVRHPDGEFSVDQWHGTKDRSWGIRSVGESIQIGAPVTPGGIFFLWAPLIWEDHISHAIFFEGQKGEMFVREALTAPLFTDAAAIPDSLTDIVDPMATAVHRLTYRSGTRWVEAAEIDLIDLRGKVRTISLTPKLTFMMKGLGYHHPEWKQGNWKGEMATGGESFEPASLNPLAPENVHLQQICDITDGTRSGIGALEHVVLGPYAPAGFNGMLDGAT